MAFYAAYLPPQKSGQSEADRLAEAALLRDGFSLSAFLFTGLWLLVKRLWLPLLAFAVIYGLIVLAQMRYGFHPVAAAFAQLVIGGWLGLEGASLAGRRLIAKGWRLADVIEARSQEEAERRFFERALAGEPATRSAPPLSAAYPVLPVGLPVRPSTSAAPSGVIGVFPEANAR